MPPFVTGLSRFLGKPASLVLLAIFAAHLHAQPVEIKRSLADLGYSQGLQQTSTNGAMTFFIPVPQDIDLTSPRLELHYEASPLLNEHSTMQVMLNGIVRREVGLGQADGRTLTIALKSPDLSKPFIEVQLRSALIKTLAPCVEERINPGFLTIHPDSGLAYGVDEKRISSVRGYLESLPHNVTIAVAQPASRVNQLWVTWLLARQLEAAGHKVGYSSFAEDSDIYIGPREQLGTLGFKLNAQDQIALAKQHPEGPVRLLLSAPYKVDAVATPWNRLLVSDGYASSEAQSPELLDRDRIPLEHFGLSNGERTFDEQAEWLINLGNKSFVPERVPAALHLNLIAPPSPENAPLTLYVFNQDRLLAQQPLSQRGGVQSLKIPLIETDSATHKLRILLKRQNLLGDCQAPRARTYVQILPSSTLETTRAEPTANRLMDLQRWAGAGAAIHLPTDALEHPQAWGNILANVSRELDLDILGSTLSTSKTVPEPGKLFLWLHPEPPAGGYSAPIRFDKGRILVRDSDGGVLLDSQALPGLSVASLLRKDGQRGLWLRSASNGVPLDPTGLSGANGDLAFIDSHGVTLNIDSRGHDLTQITYPDYKSWIETYSAYKPWLFALAWILLTLLVIGLVRRMRQGK